MDNPDANTTTSASSTESNSNTDSTSQGVAQNTNQSNENEGFHNHPRFKELVSEKNELKKQNEMIMQEMEKIRSQIPQRQSENRPDELVQKVKHFLNTDDATAEEFVRLQEQIAERKAGQIVRPVSETALQTRVDMITDRFFEQNKDAKELEPEMKKVLLEMNPYDRAQVVRMSDGGLSTLYERAKNKKLSDLLEKSKNDGRNEAYENKSAKQSITSGSSGNSSMPAVIMVDPPRHSLGHGRNKLSPNWAICLVFHR